MMKQYRLVFSWAGLVAFLLVVAPNILWAIWPPPNDVLAHVSAPAGVEIAMSASQWLMIALLVLIERRDMKRERRVSRAFATACGGLLLLYYLLWAAHYMGYAAPLGLLGMAVFPCAYFVLFAVWRRNMAALVPALVFAAIHIGVIATNFMT